MPNPASMNVSTAVTGSQGGTSGSTSNGKTQSAGVVPFVRASQLYREGPFYDTSKTLTASSQASGTVEIPAYGYARSILLVVTASGGDAGTATVATGEDVPFNTLSDIYLSEPNGATIVQFNRGYHLYLANKWGGYGWGDPRQDWDYSAPDDDGNYTYAIRIPIQINERDALGSLPNQNAAASFKLRFNLAPSTDIYTTAPDTLPSVNVKAYLEAWDQPDVSTGGVANQTTPPAMNTTQFWSEQEFDSSGGTQKIRLTRVGNYIRNLIFVVRRSNTSRSNGEADWPDPVTLYWDTRPLDILGKSVWRKQMKERSGYVSSATADAAGGPDNGVFVYDFCHEFDGHLGYENRDLWLPTLSSTRLEIQGSFAAQSDHVTVLTNDVSTAGNVFL